METTEGAGGLCCVGIFVVVALLSVAVALLRGRQIGCPECDGGKRPRSGPCPICPPETNKINVGSNPVPRGSGVKGGGGANLIRSAQNTWDYRTGRRVQGRGAGKHTTGLD